MWMTVTRCGQLGQQIQFELPGDGLGYVLAELSASDPPLDS
jgi:hypothetical protein